MVARIFRPAKTAMQSGNAKTQEWLIQFEPAEAPQIDPLMGWLSSGDTSGQVNLSFATKQEAIAFAERNGLGYQVIEPHPRESTRKSYADNFKFGRVGAWTH